jgi:hypothetical protein
MTLARAGFLLRGRRNAAVGARGAGAGLARAADLSELRSLRARPRRTAQRHSRRASGRGAAPRRRASRVSPFADGFDGAALLQRAGLALPVADVDRVTVRYPDLFALIRDLRAMGETNGLAGPLRPLTRGIVGRAADLYAERFAGADGRIPATFEIVHLAGWAPHESQQKPLPRGSAKMRLADALGVREQTGED